jgi:segregation and condensation protein B
MDPAAPSQDFLKRVIEAALLASPQPLSVQQIAGLFHDEERPLPGTIEAALEALKAEAATRGVELVEVASGFRFQVQADVHQYVARLWTERQVKYTRATLETLALIAYRHPITRGEIEQIRGVSVNANTIKMLEEREWIRVIGHRDVPGKPELFGTTRAFLDYFGLKNLDDLPSLSELKEIPELEPQLPFEPPVPAAVAMLEAETEADIDDAGEDDEEDALHGDSNDSNEEAGDEAEPELRNE